MTFLGFTGLVNFLAASSLAMLVYKKCPRRDIAITYGLMNVTIAIFSVFYFLWQMSITPTNGYFNMQALTCAAMWANPVFLYFVFTYLGMTGKRRLILWIAGILTVIFSYMNWAGILYPTVEPRNGLGYGPGCSAAGAH